MKLVLVTFVCLAFSAACGPTAVDADLDTSAVDSAVKPTTDAAPAAAQVPTPTPAPTSTPIAVPTPGVPVTSASAITSPPANMDGINSQTHVYGTGASLADGQTTPQRLQAARRNLNNARRNLLKLKDAENPKATKPEKSAKKPAKKINV